MPRICTSETISACALIVSLAAGQSARAEDSSDLIGTSLDGVESISVFATKSPITPFDYPGQVSVIDREVILDFNPSSLSSIFQAIPGATFSSGPRRTGDAPTIRGLGANGALVFLDGARQSFISGHDGRFFIDPELVQAVEVVRGPTSALYGSGALGGVIATRTVTASDLIADGESVAVRLNTGYQSVNDEFRAGITAAWQSDDGLYDVIGHITYRDAGSIDLGNDTTLPADDQIVSSLLKTTVRPSDDLELYASWMRYGGDSTDPQNPQGNNVAQTGDNDLVFRDIRSNTFQGGAAWAPEDNDLIDLKIVGYYTHNAVEEDEVESPRTVDREVQTLGFLIDNRSTFTLASSASLTLTYGGEYYQDEQTGADTETPDGTRGGVPDAATDFYGLFLQADLSLTDLGPIPGEIAIIPGLRWDGFKSSADGEAFNIDEDAFSPKIGVSYKPVPEFLIFANFAEGFRAPSFNEAFADGVHFNIPDLTATPGPFGPSFVANLFIGNPNLTPETSQTWEIGAGIDFDDVFSDGDTFTVKASYYNSNVDDLIGLDVNTPLGCFVPMFAMIQPCATGAPLNTSQNVNISNAKISGIELEFSYTSEYFYVRGNASGINGRDEDTQDFLEGTLQPNIVFVDAGVKYAPWGLRTGVRFTHAGTFDEVNTAVEERSSYTLADLYAVWTPQFEALDGVRVDIGVDNIGDTAYEVVNAGVFEAGRNFKVALSYNVGF